MTSLRTYTFPHIAAGVRQDDTLFLYLDGELQVQKTIGSKRVKTLTVNIGQEDATEAIIEDAQLFDDALFPEEIAELSAIEPSAIPLLGGAGVGSPGSAGVSPASDDGPVLLGDGDGSVTTTITYYYLNGQRVAQAKDGVFTWIHADHLSSATRITDAAGLEVRRVAYKSFGEEAENQGSGDEPKYTYTGKEQDSTGLYYSGARYYDPALSRFISADTVYDAGPQGLNRYSYALNNPILYRDPTGHEAEDEETWGIDPNYDAGAASHAQRTENDPIGSWEAPPGAGPDWEPHPYWWKIKDTYSPLYRWTGNPELTTMDLQMAPYATGGCRGVARRNGYIINPAYGHVEMWTTTDDGCPACYYRPAKSRWEVVGQYAAEQTVVIGMIGVGAVAMNPSPPGTTDDLVGVANDLAGGTDDLASKTTLPPGEEPYQLELFPKEAYDRVRHYGNTPTATQRASVPAGMEFDHDPPLVVHYYEGSGGGRLPGFNLTDAERRAYATNLSSGGAATPAQQRAQGGLAAYSKRMKKKWGL